MDSFKDNEEQFFHYLALFGLDSNYTEDELQSAYRMLAKLNHPDLNKSTTSQMRMVLINQGYQFLKNLTNTELKTLDQASKKIDDKEYYQYKKAFSIMKDAFEAYFGESSKVDQDNLELLQERLTISKKEFAKIVNESKYNQWVDDSIDKICSINKWL